MGGGFSKGGKIFGDQGNSNIATICFGLGVITPKQL